MKKIVKILIPVVLVLVAVILALCLAVMPAIKYNKAMKLMEAEDYDSAYEILKELEYKDSEEKVQDIRDAVENGEEKYAEVGEVITFGTYEQDDNKDNGAEPIEWIVLKKQEDKMLVISKCGLMCQPYYMLYEDITWKDSFLRQWLNEDFMKEAFTEEEQALIPLVKLENDDNPKYETDGGLKTEDRIFILSLTEAENYFADNEARMSDATVYAEEKGAFISDNYGTSYWWLRTPGSRSSGVVTIGTDGSINMSGERVDRYDYTVRPAMWININ